MKTCSIPKRCLRCGKIIRVNNESGYCSNCLNDVIKEKKKKENKT